MKIPIHPGKLVKQHLLKLKMTPSRAAALMDLSPEVVVKLAKCKSRISPYGAIKLALAFETTPEFWLDLQMQYDLYTVRANVFIPRINPLKNLPESEKQLFPKKERLEWMARKKKKNYTLLVRRNYKIVNSQKGE